MDKMMGEDKRQLHPSRYSIARKKARNKYQYKCALCGEYHEHISLHHIFSKSRYPQYSAEPENLIALCWKHHRKFHDLYEGTEKVNIYNLVDYMVDYANEHPDEKQSIHKIIEEMFIELNDIIEEIGGEAF